MHQPAMNPLPPVTKTRDMILQMIDVVVYHSPRRGAQQSLRPRQPRTLVSMNSAREAVDTLKAAAAAGRIDEICERLGVRLLGVFGSACRSSGPEPGDVDIAVSFAGPRRDLDLIDALVQLTEFDAIDLAVVDLADPVLRGVAFVGIPLFEAVPGAYAVAQMAALAEQRDTAWLRRLDLETMAG